MNGNLRELRAHWVSATTVAWLAGGDPDTVYELWWAPGGGIDLADPGPVERFALHAGPPFPGGVDGFHHLGGLPTLTVPDDAVARAGELVRGQVVVVALDRSGSVLDGTGLQLPGVLDDLLATDEPLGVVWDAAVPTLRLWAPTAHSVTLLLADRSAGTDATAVPMARRGGVWEVTGEASWRNRWYRYQVEVYVPLIDRVVRDVVTDPYSVSLGTNSASSQIVDLDDPSLLPDGWLDHRQPRREGFAGMTIFELHVRDFSIADDTVPEEHRGTYLAFTHPGSHGMRHLRRLADAGLDAVHLLPMADMATVDDRRDLHADPDPTTLATYPPDGTEQQALVTAARPRSGYNWGYDPLHYTTPEGSYATDPDGTARIVELRRMVQALHGAGLGVILDVVYSHTFAAGRDDGSVLDRVVPGYHHRLDETGAVTTSTCCPNTATEHRMTARLMIDSMVTWARAYRVDGFRLDLMGHHPRWVVLAARTALDALTLERDGVDGRSLALYGEGWDFGEVAGHARFVQATQLGMAGTGVGTFSDRLRDAVRGGGPGDRGGALVRNQGYVNGLWYDPNGWLPEGEALDRLMAAADLIRLGLAGNLAAFPFTTHAGTPVTGADLRYHDQPAGYTAEPSEHVVYVAAHDNETLFDIGQYHHPPGTPMADRVRAQNLANAIVALSQGIAFFHAGQDLLRSKSLDRNSYDSGDWFNRLDLSGRTSAWGAGLPPVDENGQSWHVMRPLLADPALAPGPDDIARCHAVMLEWLRIRSGSPLLRLPTADEIIARVAFPRPPAPPGVIVMTISDTVAGRADLDPHADGLVAVINPTTTPAEVSLPELAGTPVALHPVLADSVDPVVRTAAADGHGSFRVPPRTAAVFVVAPT